MKIRENERIHVSGTFFKDDVEAHIASFTTANKVKIKIMASGGVRVIIRYTI